MTGCKKESHEKKPESAAPKTSFGQAVKSARDVKAIGATRHDELDRQAGSTDE